MGERRWHFNDDARIILGHLATGPARNDAALPKREAITLVP